MEKLLNKRLLLGLLLAGSTAFAEPQIPIDTDWLLIGGELGYQEKTGVSSPEVKNDGMELGISGSYSKYQEKTVWDLGFGFRYDKMEKNSVTVTTKAFYTALSYRYRINSKWSLGPELNLLLGQDVSFSDTGTNSDDRNQSLFGGARLMYDIYKKEERDENILRLGLRAMTDLNLSERNITYVQFLVEYAWPQRRAKKMIGLKKKPLLSFNLENANINFVTGSHELEKDSIAVVHQLADILNKYSMEWDYIDISGHTDMTGTYKGNVKLSWDRADFVKRELVKKGVSARRVDTKGYGPDKPLDESETQEAFSKNRRVELELISNKASKEFINEMKTLFRAQ